MERGLQGKAVGDMQKAMLIRIYADNVRNDREELLSLVNEKGNEVQEGYPEYSQMKPFTWNVNGEEVDVNFFVDKYDKWNNQGGKDSGYQDPSKESVLEFLQNNYEDFSVDEKLKREIYWKLIDREILDENEMKKVSYSAVVLDDESRATLIKVFHPMIPEGWEIFAHHMTIKMGVLYDGSQEKVDMSEGIEINLDVIDYAIDDKVMAVGVKGYNTQNVKAHITLAVNRMDGGKPFMSNKLSDWKPINFPIELTGKVEELK